MNLEIREIKKRNINPNNKPGPKPADGKVKNKTLILLVTEDFFNSLNKLKLELEVSKAEIIRDALSTNYPGKF